MWDNAAVMPEPDRDNQIRESFGCEKCYHAPAEALWRNDRPFDLIKELVDDSHFGVDLLVCRVCGQRWVKVFCESVDWADGEDPQTWVLMPLTPEESDRLAAQGEDVDTTWLQSLGRDRRHLEADHPKDHDMTIAWVSGHLGLRRHD